MPWITLRRFAWTTVTNARGFPEAAAIKPVSDARLLPVDISDVIATNAFATTVNRPLVYDATLHEMRLIGSYLHFARDHQVQLRDKAFHASARHIRGFVSESVGMGMLTATVQAAYRWYARGQVANMDVLPTSLAASYARTGPRPDLLFAMPTARLAGEARGRSRRAPDRCLREHYKRLNQLLPWADHHQHDMVMTWTYLTGQGITVDWFMPDTGRSDLADDVGEPMPSGTPAQPVVAVTAEPYDVSMQIEQASDVLIYRDNDEAAGDQPDTDVRFDQANPRETWLAALGRRARIEEDLFTTAPQPEHPIRVAGRALRGTWAPLDLVGPSTGSLLLAVLDQPMTQAEAWETANRLRDQIRSRLDLPTLAQTEGRPIDAPLSATVRGRLVVAAAREGFDRPWDLIADD